MSGGGGQGQVGVAVFPGKLVLKLNAFVLRAAPDVVEGIDLSGEEWAEMGWDAGDGSGF